MDGKRGVHEVEQKYAQSFEREAKGKGKLLDAHI
jgi:hypothetical protein